MGLGHQDRRLQVPKLYIGFALRVRNARASHGERPPGCVRYKRQPSPSGRSPGSPPRALYRLRRACKLLRSLMRRVYGKSHRSSVLGLSKAHCATNSVGARGESAIPTLPVPPGSPSGKMNRLRVLGDSMSLAIDLPGEVQISCRPRLVVDIQAKRGTVADGNAYMRCRC
jgi:hypothetical protein